MLFFQDIVLFLKLQIQFSSVSSRRYPWCDQHILRLNAVKRSNNCRISISIGWLHMQRVSRSCLSTAHQPITSLKPSGLIPCICPVPCCCREGTCLKPPTICLCVGERTYQIVEKVKRKKKCYGLSYGWMALQTFCFDGKTLHSYNLCNQMYTIHPNFPFNFRITHNIFNITCSYGVTKHNIQTVKQSMHVPEHIT